MCLCTLIKVDQSKQETRAMLNMILLTYPVRDDRSGSKYVSFRTVAQGSWKSQSIPCRHSYYILWHLCHLYKSYNQYLSNKRCCFFLAQLSKTHVFVIYFYFLTIQTRA